jgi:hypothetical protein
MKGPTDVPQEKEGYRIRAKVAPSVGGIAEMEAIIIREANDTTRTKVEYNCSTVLLILNCCTCFWLRLRPTPFSRITLLPVPAFS